MQLSSKQLANEVGILQVSNFLQLVKQVDGYVSNKLLNLIDR